MCTEKNTVIKRTQHFINCARRKYKMYNFRQLLTIEWNRPYLYEGEEFHIGHCINYESDYFLANNELKSILKHLKKRTSTLSPQIEDRINLLRSRICFYVMLDEE